MSRDVALTFAARLLRVALSLAASVLTARALGPGGRGDYYFAVTFAGLLVQFGHLGLASSNTYLVARDRSLLRGLVANSLWVSLAVGGGGGIVVALILLGLNVFPDLPTSLFVFGVMLVFPSLFYLLGTNLLVGIGRIGAFNVVETLGNLLVLLLVAIAAAFALGVTGFLTAAVVGWTVSAVAVLLVLMRWPLGRFAFDRALFATGFRYAAKAYLITLLGYLVLRSNVFLLQSAVGSVQVGYYSIAAQIADVLIIFPSTVAVVLFPDLIRSAATRWSSMLGSAAVVTAIIAAACAVMALVAAPFVEAIYGPAFGPAVPVLLLMLPGVVFLSATTIVSQFLGAVGMPRALVAVWAATLALVTSLNLVLVPALGVAGAAVALSTSYFALLLMVCALAIRNRGSST